MAADENRRSAPPRDRSPSGWRVTPAPDGRAGGKPTTPPPPRINPRWMVVALVVGLLALNLWISSQALSPNARVRLPFYPTFTNQVTNHNVTSIAATNGAIQGTFLHQFQYQGSPPTRYFSTQVPSF